MKDYLDSVSALSISLKELITNFTIGKVLKSFITIGLISALSIIAWESFSSHFYYDKMNKRVNIISKIMKLGEKNPEINKASNEALLLTLSEINHTSNNQYESIIKDIKTNQLADISLKLLGALFIPIIALISSTGDANKKNTVIGSIIFGLVFGIAAILIPTFYYAWVTALLIVFIQILLLFIINKVL